jgi:type II secretory pathway component GspD/PulD (secretin)
MRVVFVTLSVQLLIGLLTYFSARSHHLRDADGADIYRIYPIAAWFIILVCFAFAALLGFVILTYRPTPFDAPIWAMLGELTTFAFGLSGIYYLTWRVRVDSQSLSVTSLFRSRTTRLSDIASAIDKQTGRYRSLRVTDSRGKVVLTATSSFLADYNELASSLEWAARERGVQQS